MTPLRHHQRTSWRHPEAARRVRVTAPRPARIRPAQPSVLTEVSEATPIGETYVDSLVRSHVHLSVVSLGIATAIILIAFGITEAVQEASWARVAGVAPAWFVFCPIVMIALWAAGRAALRYANHLDDDFASTIDRPDLS